MFLFPFCIIEFEVYRLTHVKVELNACETVDEISTYLSVVNVVAKQVGEVCLPLIFVNENLGQELTEDLAAGVELLLAVIHVELFVAHENPHGIGDGLEESAITMDIDIALVGIVDDHEISRFRHVGQHALEGSRTGAGGGLEAQL